MKAYPLIGESSGIMGKNRSGKSTLSEILAGVMYADSRSVIAKDAVASFPKLGAGVSVEGRACSVPAGHCGPLTEEV
jgi:ABC-type polysaccharide/polyol phosphate transport system ATPase subunit